MLNVNEDDSLSLCADRGLVANPLREVLNVCLLKLKQKAAMDEVELVLTAKDLLDLLLALLSCAGSLLLGLDNWSSSDAVGNRCRSNEYRLGAQKSGEINSGGD